MNLIKIALWCLLFALSLIVGFTFNSCGLLFGTIRIRLQVAWHQELHFTVLHPGGPFLPVPYISDCGFSEGGIVPLCFAHEFKT